MQVLHAIRWILVGLPAIGLAVWTYKTGESPHRCIDLGNSDILVYVPAGLLLPLLAFYLAPSHRMIAAVVVSIASLVACFVVVPACNWAQICDPAFTDGCMGYPGWRYTDRWWPIPLAISLAGGLIATHWRWKLLQARES